MTKERNQHVEKHSNRNMEPDVMRGWDVFSVALRGHRGDSSLSLTDLQGTALACVRALEQSQAASNCRQTDRLRGLLCG